MYVYTYTYMYTYTHIRIFIYIYVHVCIHTLSLTHTHTRTHTHTHTHTYTQTHRHTYTHTHTHTHTPQAKSWQHYSIPFLFDSKSIHIHINYYARAHCNQTRPPVLRGWPTIEECPLTICTHGTQAHCEAQNWMQHHGNFGAQAFYTYIEQEQTGDWASLGGARFLLKTNPTSSLSPPLSHPGCAAHTLDVRSGCTRGHYIFHYIW